MFMVLVEGPQSRAPSADVDGFSFTCASVGFYPTLDKAHRAIEKIKSHTEDGETVIITLCQTMMSEEYFRQAIHPF